jgi:hypothetical protein
MKFVVYYESFYIYDEIVIYYNTLRYHKKEFQYDGHFKQIPTSAWKMIFLTQKLLLAQLVKKFLNFFFTPKGTSRAHNDLSTLLWIQPSDTPY